MVGGCRILARQFRKLEAREVTNPRRSAKFESVRSTSARATAGVGGDPASGPDPSHGAGLAGDARGRRSPSWTRVGPRCGLWSGAGRWAEPRHHGRTPGSAGRGWIGRQRARDRSRRGMADGPGGWGITSFDARRVCRAAGRFAHPQQPQALWPQPAGSVVLRSGVRTLPSPAQTGHVTRLPPTTSTPGWPACR